MKYCGFLRGVNVKGTTMKMAEVVEVFKNCGLQNVSTVLATGNVLFSSEKSASNLKTLVEKAMSEHFDYEVFLFIKSENEVRQIFNNCPFGKNEDFHHYVFVTVESFENTLFEEFQKCRKSTNENAKIVENTFYWQVEKGNTLDSEFGKILGRKALKDKITSRNINTFDKIVNKF